MPNIHSGTTSLQLISAPKRPELRDWGGLFMAYLKEFLGNGSSNGLYSAVLARKLAGVSRHLITLSLHSLIENICVYVVTGNKIQKNLRLEEV